MQTVHPDVATVRRLTGGLIVTASTKHEAVVDRHHIPDVQPPNMYVRPWELYEPIFLSRGEAKAEPSLSKKYFDRTQLNCLSNLAI